MKKITHVSTYRSVSSLINKQIVYTGCSLMILEKYQIPTLTRKQSVSLKWCHFLAYPSPFWYLVSKKIHNHSVIIHLVRLLRCKTVKIWKIHWKLKYSESQYCFAHISPMEAQIFMNVYLVSLSFKFYEDPCINANIRVVNARAHVLSRVRAFTTRARAFESGSSYAALRICTHTEKRTFKCKYDYC